jgi:Kinesin motor domain
MPSELASDGGELCLTQVKGLEEVYVRSAEDIYKLLDTGSLKRRTAATLLNKQSSRSHSVFCVTVQVSGMKVLPLSRRCCSVCICRTRVSRCSCATTERWNGLQRRSTSCSRMARMPSALASSIWWIWLARRAFCGMRWGAGAPALSAGVHVAVSFLLGAGHDLAICMQVWGHRRAGQGSRTDQQEPERAGPCHQCDCGQDGAPAWRCVVPCRTTQTTVGCCGCCANTRCGSREGDSCCGSHCRATSPTVTPS